MLSIFLDFLHRRKRRSFQSSVNTRARDVSMSEMQHIPSPVGRVAMCNTLPRVSIRRFAVIVFILAVLFLTWQFLTSSVIPSVLWLSAPRHSAPSIPAYRAPGVSCVQLFAGNPSAQDQADRIMQKDYKGHILPDAFFSTLDCPSFLANRRYISSSLSAEEERFPIAFSLVIYKELGQVERLLRAIYRPQNVYCIHVDKKSTTVFQEGVKRLTSCFTNVFMAPRAVDVQWGRWTVLEADLICMRALLQRHKTWRYLINLTGQEFPLRTNLELVRILKAMNGSNAMEGTVKRLNPGRAPTVKLPFNVTWTKGSLHIVAKRAFFEFLFTNPKALKIAELLRPQPFSDETLFATLNHSPNLGTPGAYLGTPETGPDYPFLPRYKNWGSFACKSKRWVRAICIWGARDLPEINRRFELFVNKLYWNFQPLALDCLEERLFNHTMRDYGDRAATADPQININFYSNLSFAKNHQ